MVVHLALETFQWCHHLELIDELCKGVSQKHKHAAQQLETFDCSTWKSWWSKLNLSLYCQISPIKPLLHLDPNVRIKWRWTGYIQFKVDRLQIIVVAEKYISMCRNCSSVYLFVVAVFYLVQVIEMKNFIFYNRISSLIFFSLSFHCIKVIKGTMS